MKTFRAQLVEEIEAFLKEFDMDQRDFGIQAIKDASFCYRLADGAYPSMRTADKLRTWMHHQRRQRQSSRRGA
jgi:hypothetical protein